LQISDFYNASFLNTGDFQVPKGSIAIRPVFAAAFFDRCCQHEQTSSVPTHVETLAVQPFHPERPSVSQQPFSTRFAVPNRVRDPHNGTANPSGSFNLTNRLQFP